MILKNVSESLIRSNNLYFGIPLPGDTFEAKVETDLLGEERQRHALGGLKALLAGQLEGRVEERCAHALPDELGAVAGTCISYLQTLTE